MKEQSSILAPYDLPFPVLFHPLPLFSKGGSITLTTELKYFPIDEAVNAVSASVTPFFVLASETGALGGDTIPPWVTSIGWMEGPEISGKTFKWDFEECQIDERAILILVNLLLAVVKKHPLEKLTISQSKSMEPYLTLTSDSEVTHPYPPQWPTIPFSVTIDDELSETFSLTIQFKKSLTTEEIEVIEAMLLTWAGVAMCGAYAIHPQPPSSYPLIPEQTVTVFDNELEWTISKYRAHPGGINGLINICVAIDRKVAPIAEIRIE